VMSIFSQIIAGEIPCYKIAETESCYAFLDISPLAKGHVLVIPKKEVDYYFDIEEDLFNELNMFSKSIAAAMKLAIPCQRIGVAIIGLEVPHAHIHLVPIDNVSDIDFSRPKLHLPPEEMQKIATAIIDKL